MKRLVVLVLCVAVFGTEAVVLEWIGKSKVVNHHLDVPCHVLEKKWSHGGDDSGNMVIKGDNLLALKALLPRYAGKVKCIYIDPPYNTGEERWVYNDNVNDPAIQKWLNKVVGKEGEDFSRHDKWLCMMYPRLRLLQQLLSKEGIIFISIDDNEQASLKLICDEIFGSRNFVGTIAWESKTKCQNTKTAKRQLQRKWEYVLVYKNKSGRYEFLLEEVGKHEYPEKDEKGPFRFEQVGEMSASGTRARNTMIFPILGILPKDGNQWKIGIDSVKDFTERGDMLLKNGKPTMRIRPEDEDDPCLPFWSFIDKAIGTGETAHKELLKIMPSCDFETVKPHALIEALICHVCTKDENAVVLDSFAGSGTTAHAILNLNKADGGNRKFILVEMCDYAETITAERVKRVIDGYGEGTKHIEGTGGAFSFYELGEPLMVGEELNEKVATEKIREYIYYTEVNKPLPDLGAKAAKEPYLLGVEYDTAYYFCYEKGKVVTLDRELLRSIKTKADQYVIYADKCALSEAELRRRHITFKKIPRDITRL